MIESAKEEGDLSFLLGMHWVRKTAFHNILLQRSVYSNGLARFVMKRNTEFRKAVHLRIYGHNRQFVKLRIVLALSELTRTVFLNLELASERAIIDCHSTARSAEAVH